MIKGCNGIKQIFFPNDNEFLTAAAMFVMKILASIFEIIIPLNHG